jgi:hypothetical protein
MALQFAVHVAAMQVTLRAGRKRFVEALAVGAATTAAFEIVPTAKPAGLLASTTSVGSLRIDHGRDMLTQTDVYRSVFCAPCTPPAAPLTEAGKGDDDLADEPAAPTGQFAGAL